MKILKKYKVIIILIYFLLLFVANYYIRNKYDKVKNETTALIVYGKENHQELLSNRNGITSYRRALSFYAGEDSEIIYTPEIITNPDGSSYYKNKPDESKLNWREMSQIHENNIILAYSASTCNMNLEKDEVAINITYDNNYPSSFINHEITFKYNEQLISLKTRKIENFDIYSLICISDELYNELINDEENYIYDIKTKNYKTHEILFDEYENLESNDFFSISQPSIAYPIELANKYNRLSNLAEYLPILNLISIVVLVILIIFSLVFKLQKKLNS